MGKSTSINLRSLVIFHREKGKSLSEIGRLLNLGKSTVQKICERYYKENRLSNIPSTKGPRKVTPSDEFIIREIKRNPKLTSTELCKMLFQFSGTSVHPFTVRRILRKHEYYSRVARRKPLIREENRKQRLQFARKYKDKGIDFWKNVIFIDESKFSVFRSDRRQEKVWRKRNEAYEVKNLCATVKHGGEHIMVWGAMSYNGVGNLAFIEGNMNKETYLDILKTNLKSSARKLGIENSFHFYQDNDPKHKAWVVRSWLLYNCPKVIETPPQSPDINPIEHLWEHLDRKIRANHNVRRKTELRQAILEEWLRIPSEITQKLVSSMPDCMLAIIRSKGYPTKY